MGKAGRNKRKKGEEEILEEGDKTQKRNRKGKEYEMI